MYEARYDATVGLQDARTCSLAVKLSPSLSRAAPSRTTASIAAAARPLLDVCCWIELEEERDRRPLDDAAPPISHRWGAGKGHFNRKSNRTTVALGRCVLILVTVQTPL